jgi:hypothetical protein
METSRWHDLGPIANLSRKPLQQIAIGRTKVALSFLGTQRQQGDRRQ